MYSIGLFYEGNLKSDNLIALKVQEHYHLKIAGLIGLAASFVIICVALCFVLYLLVICTRKKRATQGKYRSFKFNFVFYCWRSKISIGPNFQPFNAGNGEHTTQQPKAISR